MGEAITGSCRYLFTYNYLIGFLFYFKDYLISDSILSLCAAIHAPLLLFSKARNRPPC
jgi:hypothetical protein